MPGPMQPVSRSPAFPNDSLTLTPVIIVSANGRNHNERANTVLCVPLSTMLRAGAPFQLLLKSGETGMREDGMAMADNLTVIRKEWLRPPKASQRILSNTRICELANMVRMAMGCV